MKQRWLLLTHRLPDRPSNLRVRVWRRLQALGAVPIKNSVYVLPDRASTREDFDWLRKDIVQSGGEATVFTGDSAAEKDDAEIVRDFREARAKEYSLLAERVEAFCERLQGALAGGHLECDALKKLERSWPDLRLEWDRVVKIDFFGAPAKRPAAAAIARAQRLLERARSLSVDAAPAPPGPVAAKELKGKVWVTRKSPHVDRLASAWLVRRFVDPKAAFKFVAPPYAARRGELCFDMADAEFTHFGDWCTFETLIHRLRLSGPALSALAEIIHDIDLKDRKYSRPEAPGVALAVRGLCRRFPEDHARSEAGVDFFEGLYSALEAEVKG